MKKLTAFFLAVILALSLLLTGVFASAQRQLNEGVTYSYRDIVARTYDMSYLANPPKDGEGAKQISSTDPDAKYNEETGLYENWDANYDMNGYVRQDGKWRVLADLTGPGYISRIWIPIYWTGTMRIWIDGALTVEAPMADFVSGKYFPGLDELAFRANYQPSVQFSEGYLGGLDTFVPITYNESCRVEIDCDARSGFYYQIGYYDLEPTSTVESFTWPISDENYAVLEEANAILSDESVPDGETTFDDVVAPGETVTIYEKSTAGAIRASTMKIDIPMDELDPQTALVDWLINISWDGSETPAVQLPVADFYGIHYGLYEQGFDNAAYGLTDDGTMYADWYMPYNTAKITLTNKSDAARQVTATYDTENLSNAEADSLMRFHANWQHLYARTDDRAPDAQMAYIEGTGRYVGTSLHLYTIVDGIWWGEGDEKFFVDGEKYPSWIGTGGEDYFCYAWCGSQIFDKPYCGQTIANGYPSTGDAQVVGHGDKVDYRIHITDNICFKDSIEAVYEKYFSETVFQCAATSFFYLVKGTEHPQAEITREERLFNNDMLTGALAFYPGYFLGARQIASNTSTEAYLQGMGGIVENPEDWYESVNFYWPITARGKWSEYLVELPEGGHFSLKASMTTAPSYGSFEFFLDGNSIGSVDTFGDIGLIEKQFDTVSLTPGAHILKILCIGKNEASGGYAMGLNYLEFVKAEDEPTENEYFFGGCDALYESIKATNGTSAPVPQGLDAFCSEHYAWYRNAHIYWDAGENGSVDFELNIPKSDTYQLEIAHTNAADFGKFNVAIDGVTVAQGIDAYQAGVVTGEVTTVYNLDLSAGNHTVTVSGAGRSGGVSGTLIGIDYLRFSTQTEVGAFYGGITDLNANYLGGAQYVVQDLGWVAPYVWYHNGHIYFNGYNNDQANFSITLPADGIYSMQVDYTCNADFGKFEVYIDNVLVSDTIDAYGSLGMQSATKEDISLTAGTHTLSFRGAGKNDAATNYLVGISSISFRAPYSTGENDDTGVKLTFAQKTAVNELRYYAQAAYNLADTLHRAPILQAMAQGMMTIAVTPDAQVPQALADAKAAIDAVAAAAYEEELEIDLPPYDGIFFEGMDMVNWIVSNTAAAAPGTQGLGNTWSNGGHMFWAPEVGDSMEIALNASCAGTFRFDLTYTVNGDFGMFDVYFDGNELGTIDGYSAQLGVSTGKFDEIYVDKGEHIVKFVCAGKNDASTYLYVGIDHIFLRGEVDLTAQYQAAACAYLDTYKQEDRYTTEQWQVVLQTVQEQKAIINACTTAEDTIAAWKAAKAALDAVKDGYIVYDNPVFDPDVTPAYFGWRSDENNFINWQVTEDGNTFYVDYDGSNSKRIWKDLITDPDNFTVSIEVKIEEHRAMIEVMGALIELNCEHGNGNQIFDCENWIWFNAEDQICEVVISRVNGGDLEVSLLGWRNGTPVTFTKTPVNTNDRNVYVGVVDDDASAFFSNISAADPVPVEVVKIDSAYLRIDENINVIYAAEVPADCKEPYMVFSWQGSEITVRDYTVDENGRYCFALTRVTPQCMGDSISATVYAKKNGVTVSDTVAEYSVRQYCENQLARTDDAKLVTLLSDILAYGAAAQVYTGYKTDALVTEGLSLTPSTFTALDAKKATFSGERSETADWRSATLVLANEIAMRFTFTAQSTDGLTAEITLNGRTQSFDTFEVLGNGVYAVTFDGIMATEFDDTVTAVLKQNGIPVGRTVSYSVNTYISGTQNAENTALQALVRALYNYGASAKAY